MSKIIIGSESIRVHVGDILHNPGYWGRVMARPDNNTIIVSSLGELKAEHPVRVVYCGPIVKTFWWIVLVVVGTWRKWKIAK